MEKYFTKIFEVVRRERSLIILLSLTDPDIMRQSIFTDDELKIIKNIAFKNYIVNEILMSMFTMDFLEKQISNY